MERILLVEPDYSNKYPPIGLMKIATYHKSKGDYVEFYKGKAPFTTISRMDKIYITSLFTFYFDITVDTIKHYLNYIDGSCIYFGGITATLMPDMFIKETGFININCGQLTDSAMLGYSDHVNIDELPLDYDILDDTSYEYPVGDNFFVYATRGCPRKCKFCAVKTLEPNFRDTNNLICQINYVRENYGDKRHIMLMDNNVLFSNKLDIIASDLEMLGFIKDTPNYFSSNLFDVYVGKIERRVKTGNSTAMLYGKLIDYLDQFKKRIKKNEILIKYKEALDVLKKSENQIEDIRTYVPLFHDIVEKYRSKKPLQRYVDFNQGIDARLLTDLKMQLIMNLPLRPFRLAYDNINDTKIYQTAFNIAYKHGVRHFSNYMLYNFDDTPQDLWQRAYNNINLYNSVSDVTAYSFPMKYAPIDRTDRLYIGEYWNKKFLSAMNVILNVTKGVMAKEKDFFIKAYGESPEEFIIILTMPNEFIKYRVFFEANGFIKSWMEEYLKLDAYARNALINYLCNESKNTPPDVLDVILRFYKITKYQVESGKVELANILA